jgi:hypothetical protein
MARLCFSFAEGADLHGLPEVEIGLGTNAGADSNGDELRARLADAWTASI